MKLMYPKTPFVRALLCLIAVCIVFAGGVSAQSKKTSKSQKAVAKKNDRSAKDARNSNAKDSKKDKSSAKDRSKVDAKAAKNSRNTAEFRRAEAERRRR